jgi:DNA-binding transcriptional ArsR family regulator
VADAITTARNAIEGRIQEIEEEAARLRSALAALVEGASKRGNVQRQGSASRPSARRRKVAPPGRRREQLLSHLEKNPGAKPSEIAKAIGATPANVQNVLRKAREDKLIRRNRGGGYALSARPKAPPKSAKPTSSG